jgi:hypothetical protein
MDALGVGFKKSHYSPRLLLPTGGQDKLLRIWDLRSGQLLQQLRPFTQHVIKNGATTCLFPICARSHPHHSRHCQLPLATTGSWPAATWSAGRSCPPSSCLPWIGSLSLAGDKKLQLLSPA